LLVEFDCSSILVGSLGFLHSVWKGRIFGSLALPVSMLYRRTAWILTTLSLTLQIDRQDILKMFTIENPSGNITNSDGYRDILIVAFVGTCILVRRSNAVMEHMALLLTDLTPMHFILLHAPKQRQSVSLSVCVKRHYFGLHLGSRLYGKHKQAATYCAC
jgi:hypothetical protein